MTENEQNPYDFLNRLLIENFKNLCSFSSPANKINNWLLTVVGFSISIFFYNLDTLNIYFRFSTLGWILLGLVLSGICSLSAKYFYFLSDLSYKSTANFSEFFFNEFNRQNGNNEDNLKVITNDMITEIQRRLFPQLVQPFIRIIFSRQLAKSKNSLCFEISARYSLRQFFFMGLSFLCYVLTNGLIVWLLMNF